MLTQLKELYVRYDETAKAVRKAAKGMAGMLGFGADPRNDPCHDSFYRQVGQWTQQLAAAAPAEETVMEAAQFLLQTPLAYREQESYWYMLACHGHIKLLIPLLGEDSRRTLKAQLEALYPRRVRLPLQQELIKILASACKK